MRIQVIIFYLVYFIFHLALLFVTFNPNFSFSFLLNVIDYLKYFAGFGLILFIVNGVILGSLILKRRKLDKVSNKEVSSLKAKMYDMEQEQQKKIKEYDDKITDLQTPPREDSNKATDE